MAVSKRHVAGVARACAPLPACPRRHFAVLAHKWAGGRRPSEGDDGPKKVCVMMHGILGSKSNWNTPSNRLVERIGPSGWSVLQLDHRAHGQSPAGPPPHGVQACARDVFDTLEAQGVRAGHDELVVCGHSFGGKVALCVLEAMLERGLAPPRKTWLFDSFPGLVPKGDPQEERSAQSVLFVLDAVVAASGQLFNDRAALLAALTEVHGLSVPLAHWVAQNVKMVNGGVQLGYDTDVVEALVESYRATDMWGFVESGRAEIGFVIAGKNKMWRESGSLARLRACEGSRVETVVLEDAGHNVHVDDLPGVLAAIAPSFD